MNAETRALLLRVLDSCQDLTLATVRADGTPQANIVNFAHEFPDIFVATDRNSAKVRNLQACDRVALALRTEYAHWTEVQGLSIVASAEILADDSAAAQRAKECLARRFSDAGATPTPLDAPSTVYLRLTATHISIVDYSKGYGHRESVLTCLRH